LLEYLLKLPDSLTGFGSDRIEISLGFCSKRNLSWKVLWSKL